MGFLRKSAEIIERIGNVPRCMTLTSGEKARLKREWPTEWSQGREMAHLWADAILEKEAGPLKASAREDMVLGSLPVAGKRWAAEITNTPAGQQIPGLPGLKVLSFEGSFVIHLRECLGGEKVPERLT